LSDNPGPVRRSIPSTPEQRPPSDALPFIASPNSFFFVGMTILPVSPAGKYADFDR
jgi:hypothetical protein